jgi:hypothetical protein
LKSVELVNCFGDAGHHVLRDIRCVGMLQPSLTADPKNQRLVDAREFVPSVDVLQVMQLAD